ncbi:MAG: DUF2617 family protein [bacterium]
MSSLIYKEQSVAELQYKLLGSSQVISELNILNNKYLDWQGININFSIIGSSHFVQLSRKTKEARINLIELLACVESKVEEKSVIEQKKVADYVNYKYIYEISNRFIYSFCSKLIKDHVDSYQGFREKYIKSSNYLDYIFPSNNGLAITSIEILQDTDRLSWVTYHSYPEEHMIIKTDSFIERRELR